MQNVPYIVAAVCLWRAFSLPRGKDLVVPIAMIPWWALEVEFGLSVKISEFLMVALITRHFLSSRFDIGKLPGLIPLLLFLAISLIAAAHTIEFGPKVPLFAGGGMMRNGYGRVVTTLCKISIFFGFLVLLYTHRRHVDPFQLLKAYVKSCTVLAGLGVIQMATFLAIGIDIFPIGIFHGDSARTGAMVVNGKSILRVCSFGGEPKGLGQSLAIALCMTHVFRRRFAFPNWLYKANSGLLLLVTLLTSSTSAFVTLFVVGASIFVLSKNGIPWSRWQVQAALLLISTCLIGTFIGVAATTDSLAPQTFPKIDSYVDSLIYKVTGRIRLDDTDSLIMESFVDAPLGLVAGRGLGTVHHYAHQLLPPHMERMLGYYD